LISVRFIFVYAEYLEGPKKGRTTLKMRHPSSFKDGVTLFKGYTVMRKFDFPSVRRPLNGSLKSPGSDPKLWIGPSIARPIANVACTWPATLESLRVLARYEDFSYGRCGRGVSHGVRYSGKIINAHQLSQARVQLSTRIT
jgi:hypothetical protein